MDKKAFGDIPTPDKVEELCAKTPWSSDGLHVSAGTDFGTVPEFFEKASKAMPEGSEQQKKYHDAYLRARDIYKQQLLADVRSASRGQDRAGLEAINTKLWHMSHRLEKEDNYVSTRLWYAAEMVGDWYYKQNPDKAPEQKASGNGYRQWKIVNKGHPKPPKSE